MAQLEDKLSAMLGDEQSRQSFLNMVSMLSSAKGGSSGGVNESPDGAADAEGSGPSSPAPDISADESDKTAALFSALPQLLAALSGTADTLDGKRVNLIRAISPYLSEERGECIARAIRMASVAKATKDTLGVLGR